MNYYVSVWKHYQSVFQFINPSYTQPQHIQMHLLLAGDLQG